MSVLKSVTEISLIEFAHRGQRSWDPGQWVCTSCEHLYAHRFFNVLNRGYRCL